MLCPQCGKSVEDGTMTCPYCGASLQPNAQPEASAPIYTRPPVADPPPAYQPAYQSSEMPVIQLMRRTARSPVFLVPAIAYTCMVLFQIVATFFGAAQVALDPVVTQTMETNAFLQNIYTTSVTFSALPLSYIFSILVAVGIWMTYASAANQSGAPIKTAGLTLLRVLQIISLVVVCLMTLLLIGGIVIFIGTMGMYNVTPATNALIVALLLMVAALMALLILYSVKIITTIECFRRSIRTGTPQGKISVYVAVMSILGGLISLTSVLTGNVFSALAGVASAVSGIGFGVFLFRYREEFLKIPSPADAWHRR